MVRLGKLALPLMAVALVSAGCASTPSPGASGPAPSAGANVTGETSSKRAVETFMRAVKAQDLQQMGTAWGTARGPARDQMDRETLEKRLIVIQCTLQHDGYSFTKDAPQLQAGGRHEYEVEVRKGKLRARTSFTTVQGPQGRWYVEIVDIQPLKDFCS